jgi:hypothetical protein
MNAQVLSNPPALFHRNEYNAIVTTRMHTNLGWDKFQVVMRDTPKVPKPTFVKLASIHILQLFGMIACGVGFILFNMQAKVECNEDLVVVI